MEKKIVLITGPSRGLGFVISKRFLEGGYHIIAVVRNDSSKRLFLNSFKDYPTSCFSLLTCDLNSQEEVNRLLKIILSNFSHIDCIINNAAIQGPIGPLTTNNMDQWNNTFQVNLFSPVAICHGLISLLRKSSNASIINISGGGATGPRPNFSAYASSKAALVRFSETLSYELADYKIKVNCIAPGAMKTNITQTIVDAGSSAGIDELNIVKNLPQDFLITAQNAAELVFFLSSCRRIFITGKLISALWDNWKLWGDNVDAINKSDVFTLRRIIGKDRDLSWADK